MTTSESDNVILAVHRIIVAARFDPGLIRNTSPVVSNLKTRRPNPILNFLISLGFVNKDANYNGINLTWFFSENLINGNCLMNKGLPLAT